MSEFVPVLEYTVNCKAVDLRKSLPLTMGDYKKLLSEGVNVSKIDVSDLDVQSKFVLYVLRKANADITMDDVDMLTSKKLANIVKTVAAVDDEDALPPLETSSNM